MQNGKERNMEKTQAERRTRVGKTASIVGVFVNILLAIGKITVGVLFGLISVTADGLNNLTDCGSSLISALSFKLSSKPADKEHPYGHERIEYICSLAIAFIIMLVAFETGKESVAAIFSSTSQDFSYAAIATLAVSIAMKCALFFYYRATAKKINSNILRATAADSLSDCVSTSVVLLACVIGRFFSVDIDGYVGVLVALFIAWSGVNVLRDTFSKLIGQAPTEEMLSDIKKKILAREGVLGVHDLSVYSYGPNKYFASAHVEVDARVDVLVSHELLDEIEREFAQNTNVILTAHLDPIVTDDACVNALRKETEKIVKEFDESFSIHDFRMVRGEKRINVLFDVAVPYDKKVDKQKLISDLEKRICAIDARYRLIVTIENSL